MAMPAVITTAISPSVSSPRKSTRMTLTTLRPCASGTLLALKKSLSRASSGPRARAEAAASSPPGPQNSASAPSRSQSSNGRPSRASRLSRVITSARITTDRISTMNWVKLEVRRAEQQEEQRHRQPLHPERQDGEQPRPRSTTVSDADQRRQQHHAPFVEGQHRPQRGQAGSPPSDSQRHDQRQRQQPRTPRPGRARAGRDAAAASPPGERMSPK